MPILSLAFPILSIILHFVSLIAHFISLVLQSIHHSPLCILHCPFNSYVLQSIHRSLQIEASEDDEVDDDDDEVVPIFPEEKFRPFALEKMVTVIAYLVEEAKGQSYVSVNIQNTKLDNLLSCRVELYRNKLSFPYSILYGLQSLAASKIFKY